MELIFCSMALPFLFACGMAVYCLNEMSETHKKIASSVSVRKRFVRLEQSNGQALIVNRFEVAAIEPADNLGLESNIRLRGSTDCWRKVKLAPDHVVDLLLNGN